MVQLRELITPAPLVRCGSRELPVLSMTMHDGIMLQSDRFKKSIASVDQSLYKIVKRNQLVVGFPIDEGVLYIQNVVDEGIMSPAYDVWNVDQSKIDLSFLELSLHSPRSMLYYKSNLRGTTARRRSLPKDILLSLPVCLPSIENQKKISEIIKKTNYSLLLHKQQLQALDDLVKARFVEMFGDAMMNDKGYKLKKYGEVFELNAGGTPPKDHPEYWDGGTISWIGSNMCQDRYIYENDGKYITQEGYNNSSARLFPIDTVLVALVGATIGKTALLKFETTTNQNVLGIRGIRENGYLPEFVFYYTQGLYMKFMGISNGGFAMASKGFISELPIPVVSMTLQEEFTGFADQVDKSKVAVQKALDETQKLFDSLMQEYFG